MRNLVIIVLVLAAVGWLAEDVTKMFRANTDFEASVQHYLDAVDAQSFDTVKRNLVDEAAKLGLKVEKKDITIGFADTQDGSFAQNLVVGVLGARFVNKRASIKCHYTASVLGLSIGFNTS